MLRVACAVACRAMINSRTSLSLIARPVGRMMSCGKFLTSGNLHTLTTTTANGPLALSTNPAIINLSNNLVQHQQTRNVIKFSKQRGIRQTDKNVLKRFKRLDWGIWIRTRSGKHKKLWKKSTALRNRLKQHVFVNATQSWLLDKMVTKYWRRPKYYLNDPYRPYHKRDSFWATRTTPTEY